MSLVETAYDYLKLCKIEVSKEFFEKRMKSNENYPSLASFTDTLDELDLEEGYVVLKTDASKIAELSFPFFALTPTGVTEFEIVPSLDYYLRNQKTLLHKWEGVVLMASPSQKGNNKENILYLANERKRSKFYYSVLIFIICTLFALQIGHFNFISFCFLLSCIMGIGITSLIIMHKLGKDNKLTKQLCTTEKNNSCDLVLNSKASKLRNGLNLGDAGLIYFTAQLLFIIFCDLLGHTPVSILQTLTITIAFIGTLFSLYYQWKVVKAWCKMCLITTSIVWIQTSLLILDLAFNNGIKIDRLLNDLPIFLLSFSFASIWLLVKPLAEAHKKSSYNEIEVLRWKRNTDIFESLLYKGVKTDTTIPFNPVIIGNKNAPIQLTIVTNPFCKPCADAHEILQGIYSKNPTIVSLNIIFFVTSREEKLDKRIVAVTEIINTILAYNNVSDILNDWFATKDITAFKHKYPNQITNSNTDNILQSYEFWCEKNRVPHTPLVYFNGYSICSQYNLDEIDSFIAEMDYRIKQGLNIN